MGETSHIDRFVLDHLPQPGQQPHLIFSLPELAYPARLNAAAELLRRQGAQVCGNRGVKVLTLYCLCRHLLGWCPRV